MAAAKDTLDKNFATLAENHEQIIKIKDDYKVRDCKGYLMTAMLSVAVMQRSSDELRKDKTALQQKLATLE